MIERNRKIPCTPGLERINTVKITILPRAISRLSEIPINTPHDFFLQTGTNNPKIHWNHKIP